MPSYFYRFPHTVAKDDGNEVHAEDEDEQDHAVPY